MRVRGNATAIVTGGEEIAGFEHDFDEAGMAGDRFIHGIIQDFRGQMVHGGFVGAADIHAGAAAHGFQPLEDFDVLGGVVGAGALGFAVAEEVVHAVFPYQGGTLSRPLESGQALTRTEMVIGENFIWLHLPKCAGTETELVLRRHFEGKAGLAFDEGNPQKVIWHHSIAQRERLDPRFRANGRAVICNIRRLPAWLLSRVHAGKNWRPDLVVTREMLLAGRVFRRDGTMVSADDILGRYIVPPVTHWLRTEALAADFVSVFGQYLDVSGIDAASFAQRNMSEVAYIRDVPFWFTGAELAALYRANPAWAAVERAVYGSLIG